MGFHSSTSTEVQSHAQCLPAAGVHLAATSSPLPLVARLQQARAQPQTLNNTTSVSPPGRPAQPLAQPLQLPSSFTPLHAQPAANPDQAPVCSASDFSPSSPLRPSEPCQLASQAQSDLQPPSQTHSQHQGDQGCLASPQSPAVCEISPTLLDAVSPCSPIPPDPQWDSRWEPCSPLLTPPTLSSRDPDQHGADPASSGISDPSLGDDIIPQASPGDEMVAHHNPLRPLPSLGSSTLTFSTCMECSGCSVAACAVGA